MVTSDRLELSHAALGVPVPSPRGIRWCLRLESNQFTPPYQGGVRPHEPQRRLVVPRSGLAPASAAYQAAALLHELSGSCKLRPQRTGVGDTFGLRLASPAKGPVIAGGMRLGGRPRYIGESARDWVLRTRARRDGFGSRLRFRPGLRRAYEAHGITRSPAIEWYPERDSNPHVRGHWS